jgi:hypothetical protein
MKTVIEDIIRRKTLGQVNVKLRLAIFLALMALAIPISIGCFESPLQSSSESVNQGDTSLPTDSGGSIDTTDTGTVGDTTDPGDTSSAEVTRVLPRNSEEISTDPLSDLLDSAVRLILKLLGGTISLVDMTLDIPANSLDRNTTITVDMPDPDLYIYDFGPDGTQFSIPATITISYDYADLSNIDESKIRLGWWDEANGTWVTMPCAVDQSSNTVVGQIDHFSSYGLISD